MKFKNYPFWRFDKPKTQIIQGGWHFSYLMSEKDIQKKIKSWTHSELDTNENNDLAYPSAPESLKFSSIIHRNILKLTTRNFSLDSGHCTTKQSLSTFLSCMISRSP